MSKGSGGGGRPGRTGDAGQPGEVIREANKANEYGPGTNRPLSGSQPLPGDNQITAAVRAEYGNGRRGVNVAVEQLRSGATRMTHPMGTATLSDNGVIVQASQGKRYDYKDYQRGIAHWESLAGMK